jgi:protein SCO1/2
MRTKKIITIPSVAMGAILLIVFGYYLTRSHQKPTSVGIEETLNPSGDFTLTETSGKLFRLKDHRGKVVLLFFGYTSCPNICPTTLAKFSKVRSLLRAMNQKVMTVFVTVDPQRDTAERLKEYLGYFDNRAIGLTGTKTEIDKVVNAYKASYQKIRNDSSPGYTINHTSIIYLIDGQGKVRYLFHQDDRPEKMVSIIEEISAGE